MMKQNPISLKKLVFRIWRLIVISLVIIISALQYYSLQRHITNYQKTVEDKFNSIFELHKPELLDEVALGDVFSLREHLKILRRENHLSGIRLKSGLIDVIEEDHELDYLRAQLRHFLYLKTDFLKVISDDFGTVKIEIYADYFRVLLNEAIYPNITLTLGALAFFLCGISLIFFTFYFWIRQAVLEPLNQLARLALGEINKLPPNIETVTTTEILDLSKVILEAKSLREQAVIAKTTQMLAHDVRRPFSTLTMGLQLLKNTPATPEMQRVLSFLIPFIEKSARDVDGMIQDVLQLGTSYTMLLEGHCLRSLLREAIVGAVGISGKRGISLSIDVDHIVVKVDPIKIKRIFSNILGNALDEMSAGDSLWVKASQPGREQQGFLKVVIGNSGSYIPPNKQTEIFDYFYSTGKRAGTGLGLAICRKFIQDHGGHIECQAWLQPRKCVEFVFTLPLSDSGVESKNVSGVRFPQSTDEVLDVDFSVNQQLREYRFEDDEDAAINKIILGIQHSLGRKIRIAIVDDDVASRLYLSELLDGQTCRQSVQFDLFACGEDLLEKNDSVYDLVICDIEMRHDGLSGFETLERYSKICPTATKILHSNRFEHDDLQECFKRSADGFILKPMTKIHLLKFISKIRVNLT